MTKGVVWLAGIALAAWACSGTSGGSGGSGGGGGSGGSGNVQVSCNHPTEPQPTCNVETVAPSYAAIFNAGCVKVIAGMGTPGTPGTTCPTQNLAGCCLAPLTQHLEVCYYSGGAQPPPTQAGGTKACQMTGGTWTTKLVPTP